MSKCIVLTGGGTAGHIIPNLALLPLLKRDFSRIIYIGSNNAIEQKLLANHPDIEYYSVETAKLKRSINFSNFLIPIKLFKGYQQAKQLLKELKPEIIFSKGGYVAIPIIFAGKKLNIPMIAHESDYTMGLANKLTQRNYQAICTTFFDTATRLSRGIWVGSPLNIPPQKIDKTTLFSNYKLDISKPLCLVVGGSLGADYLNKAITENIDSICKTHQVLHITGKGKCLADIKHKNYTQVEFITDLISILPYCDIAITRGGSNAIHEFLHYAIPMLIIPLQKGSRGDQVQNGIYFEKKGFALLLTESEFKTFGFMPKFNLLLNKKEKIRNTQKLNQPQNATELIYKLILKYKKQNII